MTFSPMRISIKSIRLEPSLAKKQLFYVRVSGKCAGMLMDNTKSTAAVLVRLFELSGMTPKEFIQQSGISESQFYKILQAAKSPGSNFDCMLSTANQWVAASAETSKDLQGEWFSLVLELYLTENTIARLAPAQPKKENWLIETLDSFLPDSLKLLKKR